MTAIVKASGKLAINATCILIPESQINDYSTFLSIDEIKLVESFHKLGKSLVLIPTTHTNSYTWVQVVVDDASLAKGLENIRKAGATFQSELKGFKADCIVLKGAVSNAVLHLAFAEGLALSSYTFDKYKTDEVSRVDLETIYIDHEDISDEECSLLQAVVAGTCLARNLVNEPVSYLTATQFSKDIQFALEPLGVKVEVLEEVKIESLRMGGLLAVNKGSQDPPTFNIIEYKPEDAANEKPIVLIGKGVVFDTGGLSLKPTLGSMDSMKSDMAGAAAVVGALHAVATAKLPIYVVGLIPATDNRPGENAICPGDVITTMDGTTIEVLNTDAEGRLILADAISYAAKYDPDLIIDLATLTGAAARAIGQYGIVYMGNATDDVKDAIEQSGVNTWERMVEFPLWDEYLELLKSDIADMKNVGNGGSAGASIAGKFLEHFAGDIPWLHLDIAGPAFITSTDSYRGKNGTGVGVRLLFDFLLNYNDTLQELN
ncbi:MAG: leucyl aminopeptidase family protein [Bacteroidota bacterium]|nr:leucyl aminopeptidase family protein [Bacteroidota bacterium]